MAVDNVGSIEYDARINTSKLKSDAKSVEGTVSDTTKHIGNELDSSENKVANVLGNIMGKVKAAALGVATAVGAAGVASAAFGIKSAADFEQTRIGLENMLGSADKARSLLSDISDFAAQTPFEFPELAQATRQLVAFGFTGEDAFKTMKQLGDVSAAVGAPINDLAYLMGTLRTQGRAFTVDIRQFAQRGIPIYEYLAKVLGKDEKAISQMIEAGKIGFPEVQKAFQAMTGEGGKFYKTMDKQSQSLSGQFSTLKDNLGQTLRELIGISKTGDIIQGSLFDRITEGIGNINSKLPSLTAGFQQTITNITPQLKQWAANTAEVAVQIGQYLSPKVSALWTTLSTQLLPAIRNFVVAIGPAVGTGLVFAIGLAVDSLNMFLAIISPVIDFLADNTWVVWGVVAAYTAFKAALLINSAVAAFTGALALADAALIVSGTKVTAATRSIALLKLGLAGLTGPWQIVLAIIGAAAIIAAIKEISDWLDKLLNKWSKASDVGITKDIKVKSNSDLGLTKRLMDAFGGFRASGGPVSAGNSYIVGEKRPEVFVPSTSGTIIPDTDMLGRNVSDTVNIKIDMNGLMARSRSDLRDIAKDLVGSINEELGAKGKPLLGGGYI